MKSMDTSQWFYPPRRKGTFFHVIVLAGLAAAAGWAIWRISQADIVPELIPYLAVLAADLILVPVFLYRLYALHRAHYYLERGSLHLQWGWRQETVPLHHIQWVHPYENLENPPRPPLLHWPGAVIGTRKPARDVTIEFLAAETRQPVMIAAANTYYVISPEDPAAFAAAYQQFSEWGSLRSPDRISQKPAALITDIRSQKTALGMLAVGLILNLTLWIWVLILIPRRQTVSLGFSPAGTPNEPLGSVRLVLLPILNNASFLANLLLGFFLNRRGENRIFAYLLWATSVLVAVLFHIGLGLILR
jgi:hypothetical protein